MSKWIKKPLNSGILYSFVILLFTAGISIDLVVKLNKSFDKFSIFFSSLIVTVGFVLLLIEHFFISKWLYGFVIVSILTAASIVSTIFDFISYYQSLSE